MRLKLKQILSIILLTLAVASLPLKCAYAEKRKPRKPHNKHAARVMKKNKPGCYKVTWRRLF